MENQESNETTAGADSRRSSSSDLLGGLSVMTVMNLKWAEDEDMVIAHGGPSKGNGKYCGWITNLDGRPVVNSDAIFDTPEEAEDHMRKVVAACRTMDLSPNDEMRDAAKGARSGDPASRRSYPSSG